MTSLIEGNLNQIGKFKHFQLELTTLSEKTKKLLIADVNKLFENKKDFGSIIVLDVQILFEGWYKEK